MSATSSNPHESSMDEYTRLEQTMFLEYAVTASSSLIPRVVVHRRKIRDAALNTLSGLERRAKNVDVAKAQKDLADSKVTR